MIDREALAGGIVGAILTLLAVWVTGVSEGSPDVTCHCAFEHPDSVVVDSVASLLLPGAREPRDAHEIARIVVREARAKRLDPMLVAGVIRVENPWLIHDTVSYAGAVGIMQIMEFHEGGYGCSGPLDDRGTNVCLGTSVLSEYLSAALATSLLQYNGCSSWNTRCQGYPDLVQEGL